MKSVRVLLVAQDNLVRLGLRTLLTAKTTTIAGEAAGPLDGVAKCSTLRPDVAVIDLSLSPGAEFAVLREISRACSHTRLVLLSDRDDEHYVEQAVMCGASAYLLKQTAAADLAWAMRAISRGREYFSPLLIHRLRDPAATVPEPEQHKELSNLNLSPLEARLFRMIQLGLVIRHAAQELCANLEALRRQDPELLRRFRARRLANLVAFTGLGRMFGEFRKRFHTGWGEAL